MPLFVTKINSESTDVNFTYLNGESIWGYVISSSYEFDISDTTYTDGDDILYEGKDALDRVYLNQNIVGKIGSNEIINGLVTSISYPETPSVGRTTASISIQERKRVDSHGALESVINNIPSPQDVESFSETFSFERSENSYSRTRNVSLKYKQDAGHFFLDKAKIFVQNMFFESRPSFGYQNDGISENARFNLNLKPIFTEEIDLLNKEISFSETVNTNRINLQNLSSESVKINQSTDENGYKSKTYTATLKALQEPLESNINNIIKTFVDEVYQENSAEFKYPVSISKTLNSDGGTAEVSVSFNSNPSLNSITNALYTVSKTREGEWDEYSFSMTIKSKGISNFSAFINAKNYWIQNKDIGLTKVLSLFPEAASFSLYEKSIKVSFDEFNRTVQHDVVYTTNPDYQSNGNILKQAITVSDQKGVERFAIVPILGERELLRRRANSKTLSSRSVNVTMTSKDLKSLESQALTIAQSYVPTAAYYYISNKTTKFDPINGVSTATVNFDYFD
jgi:hypothetical protein